MGILTKEGYEKLKREVEQLKEVEMPRAAADLKEAIAQGDISENAAYDEARDRKSDTERRIKEIEKKLAGSTIAEVGEYGGKIEIGKSFSTKDKDSGNEREFFLVGSEDAMPSEGKISFDSPIGQAFWGKKEGETVEVTTPNGKKLYIITKVY